MKFRACIRDTCNLSTSSLLRGAFSREHEDLDVHQGDGTAEILGEDAPAFTLSVHCKDIVCGSQSWASTAW